MHSKRRYKICICSVILGVLESSKLQGLYRKILDAIYLISKVRTFLIPPSFTILNPKILGFLFGRKIS